MAAERSRRLLMPQLVVALLVIFAALVNGQQPEDKRTVAQLIEEAKTLLSAGQGQAAIDLYTLAIGKEPSNYLPLYMRALASLMLGKSRPALRDLDGVIQINPVFDQALLKRGELSLKIGDFNTAKSDFRQLLQQKDDAEVKHKLELALQLEELVQSAKGLIEQGDYVAAEQALSRGIEIAPQSEWLRAERANCYALRGDREMAMADYKRAVQMRPDLLENYPKLTEQYFALGELNHALEALKQCLHSDPEYKPCLQIRRTLKAVQKAMTTLETHQEAGNWAKVIEHVQQIALPLLPADGAQSIRHRLLAAVCEARLQLKEPSKAVEDCDEAIKLDPNDADSIVNRAEANILLEEYDAAVRDYKRAQEIRPHDQKIQSGLAAAERAQRGAKQIDYYKVLGVPRTASKADIKKAYRKLAQEWHPDKYKGDDRKKAENKMIQINMANDVLSDDNLRAQYDQGIDPNDPGGHQQQHFHQGHHGHHHHHGGHQQFHFGGGFPFNFGGGNFQFRF